MSYLGFWNQLNWTLLLGIKLPHFMKRKGSFPESRFLEFPEVQREPEASVIRLLPVSVWEVDTLSTFKVMFKTSLFDKAYS